MVHTYSQSQWILGMPLPLAELLRETDEKEEDTILYSLEMSASFKFQRNSVMDDNDIDAAGEDTVR
jgi:hypothetical protein